MTAIDCISLIGGLALFLYGMSVMSGGLEKISGGRLEAVLERMTDNIFKGVLLGALVTSAIQSSSATTVIVVGLVNAGILRLRQAIGIIMGANIGTTITAHILRLGDLDGTGILAYLKPSTLAPIAAIVGALLYYAAKRDSKKEIGVMLLGFAVLFTGMFSMEAAVRPLQDVPQFRELLASFSNPILGVLTGAGVTAVIQSSSASVGILQAISSTGAIAYSAALPIIMGQNIGTCITSVLASIGTTKNARRAAFIHVTFNVIGTAVFLIGIYAIQYTVGFSFWDTPIDKGGIANFHTIFNVSVTILLIPFAGLLEKLACRFIKTDEKEQATMDSIAVLDDRFLASPGFAVKNARDAVVEMARLAAENFQRSIGLIRAFDQRELEHAREVENIIDQFQSKVDIFLLKITKKELGEADHLLLSEVLQVVNEFERIGDHADNICDCAESLRQSGAVFSDSAFRELDLVSDAVREITQLAVEGYKNRDAELALTIEPLEDVVNIMVESLKVRHNERLQRGLCSLGSAFPYVEILYNLERIADHCSNVGVHIISYSGTTGSLDRHEYLREIHRSKTPAYQEKFEMYDRKYFGRLQG